MQTTKRSLRIIERLRQLFPNENWRYDRELGGRWLGTTFDVFAESHCYDESRGTHLVKYKRNDTYQLIEELGCREEYCG